MSYFIKMRYEVEEEEENKVRHGRLYMYTLYIDFILYTPRQTETHTHA